MEITSAKDCLSTLVCLFDMDLYNDFEVIDNYIILTLKDKTKVKIEVNKII